jgi:hypothetical protein
MASRIKERISSMPRERSTWNVHNIAKRAGLKVADPYLMNQDHVNQQPSADQYVIGGPPDFAEDVHPAAGTWEAEYANGQVKRNEIGMPEMRSDTFNHPEKTASEEVITKKAALCVAIARRMLPKTASATEIEDQSFSLMYLPNTEVMATYTRLAAQDEEQDQQQQVQASQQQQDQQQGQQVQAGQIPPQFLENVKKKKEEAADKKDQGDDKKAQDQQQQDQGQQKQAEMQQQGMQQQIAQLLQQAQQLQDQLAKSQQQQAQDQQQQGQQKQAEMQQQGMQQQIAQLLQQAQQLQDQLAKSQQQQAQVQQQQPVAQIQQQSQAQQIAQAVQQAIQNGQDPVAAAQQYMGQSQQQSNNEIDQMLAEQGQVEPMANMDIQLDTPSMDVGEVQLSPEEDDTLRQLFANNQEYKNAQEAAGQGSDDQQGQQQQKQAHVVRTASMRTVGTRPTAGVSQIGGSNRTASSRSEDLSTLWNSAPDVREAFGMRTDQ